MIADGFTAELKAAGLSLLIRGVCAGTVSLNGASNMAALCATHEAKPCHAAAKPGFSSSFGAQTAGGGEARLSPPALNINANPHSATVRGQLTG